MGESLSEISLFGPFLVRVLLTCPEGRGAVSSRGCILLRW